MLLHTHRADRRELAPQVLFVLAAMAATFLLVPRGFSAGEINIEADKMSWNVRTPAAAAGHVRCLAGAAARSAFARNRRAG